MRIRESVLATLLCLPTTGMSQEALVLSGGGSRGLAHAGVFLALEELGYDPDIVIGTSMGAVVGALYAAGYEPTEIRERLEAVNWIGLFAPAPTILGPERAVRYAMFNLDLDLANLRVSRGLLGQWRINRTLARLLFDANARSRGDFDRLARRYRAIATDLQTGDAVVLDSGDLARAARASMAVPGFFAPVRWNERVLIDGGIVDNLPTALARSMGATRVIASDVSRPPAEIPSQAPFAVIGRAIDLMQENTQRDPIPPDVLILPEVPPGTSAATFPADPGPLVELGLVAARAALPPVTTSAGRGQRPLPAAPDSFAALIIHAPDSALAALAQRAFDDVAPGRYNAGAVLNSLDKLYTSGLFEAVWPSVSGDSLVVRLDGPPALSLSSAIHYESDRGGRVWGAVDRYQSWFRHPVVLTASISLEGLAANAALAARVHSLVFPGLAWSSGLHLQERKARSFTDDVVTTKETLRSGGWLGVEFPHILRARSIIANVRGEWIEVEDGPRGFGIGPLLRWGAVDEVERIIGAPLLLEVERRWGTWTYTRAALRASHVLHLGRLQLAPLADLRAVSPDAPLDVHPTLGDEHAVPGLRWGDVRGNARAVGGIDVAHPVFAGFLAMRIRSGSVADEIDEVLSGRWVTGAQAAVVWPSPIGAVEVAYGLATRAGGRFDVSVGRRF